MPDNARPPKYALSPLAIAYLSARIFTGLPRRTLGQDAAWIVSLHDPRPQIAGLDHLPKTGGVLIVANHYQRPGLWIGWAGGLITHAVNRSRPALAPVRLVVTDSQRVTWFGRERMLPFSRFFLGRMARAWQMIPIPADRTSTAGQAVALKAVLKLLADGQVVLFFPEGERGTANGLIEALPGTGSFMALAARRGVLLPCAVWETGEGGAQLYGQFGMPITLAGNEDRGVRRQVMGTIAAMLPERLRGVYL